MRVGGFGRIADYDSIRRAGFDYAELDLPELEELPEKEFCGFCDKVHDAGFPVLIGARALPITEPWFFTDSFCAGDYSGYLKRACRRAKRTGIKKIIFGNGQARLLTENNSVKKEGRFLDFMRMFADTAGCCDLEIILEPLGPKYSNYINTLSEAVQIIRKVNMPNFFTMADLRHMYGAKEPFADIVAYVDYVHHIHMDYPVTFPARLFPRVEDRFDYTGFLDAIEKSGYQDTLTIEADVPTDWNKAYGDAVNVLKKFRCGFD